MNPELEPDEPPLDDPDDPPLEDPDGTPHPPFWQLWLVVVQSTHAAP
jgi:hypothetical protein